MINLSIIKAFFDHISTSSFVENMTSSLNRMRDQIRSIISDLGLRLTRQSSESDLKSRTWSNGSSSAEDFPTKSFKVGEAWEKYVLIGDVWVPKEAVADYDANTVWKEPNEIPDEDDDGDNDVFYDARTECYDPDLESSTLHGSTAGPSKNDALTPSVSTLSFETRFKAIDLKKVVDISEVKNLKGLPETCTIEQVAKFINETLGHYAKGSFFALRGLMSQKDGLELLGKAVSDAIDPMDGQFSCLAYQAIVFNNPNYREYLRAVLKNIAMSSFFINENGAKLSQIFPKANFGKNEALIRGFAEYLKVDPVTVLNFFREENWKGLLDYLSDEKSYQAAK